MVGGCVVFSKKYCKRHTGAIISLGKGAITSFSRKKKIQGKIYTDDDLIGTYDALQQAIWTKYFI